MAKEFLTRDAPASLFLSAELLGTVDRSKKRDHFVYFSASDKQKLRQKATRPEDKKPTRVRTGPTREENTERKGTLSVNRFLAHKGRRQFQLMKINLEMGEEDQEIWETEVLFRRSKEYDAS